MNQIELEKLRLRKLIKHITGVQENCNELAFKLSERGEHDFARQLIANGMVHDVSKFSGIEWEHLHEGADKALFKEALLQHVTTNSHHPEFYGEGGIHDMPRIYTAEMVADWYQRSKEFGSDLQEWINEVAKERWNFDFRSEVGKEIKDFVTLLLDKRFS